MARARFDFYAGNAALDAEIAKRRRPAGEEAAVQRVVAKVPTTPLSFAAWVDKRVPVFTRYRAHDLIMGQVQRLLDGDPTLRKLMVFTPPRLGKSQIVSRMAPAYALSRRPDEWTAVVSYGAKLAHRLSRAARQNYTRERALSKDSKAVDVWETGYGGGCWSTGIGGPASGFGYRFGVIDDPVKDWQDANSDAIIERNIDWWDSVFTTRRDADKHKSGSSAAMLLTMTRYTMRDLAGHILATQPEGWTVLHMPMIWEPRDEILSYYDEMTNNAVTKGQLTVLTDWRTAEDQPLCPEMLDPSVYTKEFAQKGSHVTSALYQQRPSPRVGAMFPRDKVTVIEVAPSWQHIESVCRYWDKAGTKGGSGAATAGVKIARLHDGRFVVLDVYRDRLEALEREAVIKTTATIDGPECLVRVEQEPGSGGKESAQGTVRELAGYLVKADRVTGDKTLRAELFAAQWQAGNVMVVRAPWTEQYLMEATHFPSGRQKDQIDASSGAFNTLLATPALVTAMPQGSEQVSPYPI